ncbi:hypothetical protein CF98_00360 [Halopseudomonas bauzanensis]|nr:hypothetical protein CF98_00360 [Halopseudomonas bauzanensis]
MTERNNPFLTKQYGDRWTGKVTAEDRVRMVAVFGADQCVAALLVPGLQKSVKTAIERRQRKLAKT